MKSIKPEKIILFGNPVLRQGSLPVVRFGKRLHDLLDTMHATLAADDDGAALAAPQISVLNRVVVISVEEDFLELVNPEILEARGEIVGPEGCLSLPGYTGNVRRAEEVTVKFFNRFGKEIIATRSGFMARGIQHEIDHLDGILFIDRMEVDFVYGRDGKSRRAVRELRELTRLNSPEISKQSDKVEQKL